MGLADNAARAAGEKIVVPPKPTIKPVSPSASSPTVTAANGGKSETFAAAQDFVVGKNIGAAMRGEQSWNKVTGTDIAMAAATFVPLGIGAKFATTAATTAAKAAVPTVAKAATTTAAKAVTPTAARAVTPTVAGPSLSVAQSGAAAVSRPTLSAAAGLSNMAADVKNAASFVANNTVARNTVAATGAAAAGAAVAEPVKDFIGGITSSTAAPTQRPTTTGGTTPAPTSIDAGKVSTPENAVPRPTSTGGSTAAPTNIGGSSLPADTVNKPALTGTPASVVTGSSTGAGVTTGSAAGTTTGSAAGAAAGAGSVTVPGSIPVPIGSTTTGVGSTTGSTTRADSTTRTESVARDEVLSNRPNRSFPRLRVPNLPDINGSPVAQGSVQSDWQDFRGTSSVTYKQTASSGPSTATFAVSGKDKGEKNAAPAEDKGAKTENPTSTRPTATTGRRSGWQYSESAG